MKLELLAVIQRNKRDDDNGVNLNYEQYYESITEINQLLLLILSMFF